MATSSSGGVSSRAAPSAVVAHTASGTGVQVLDWDRVLNNLMDEESELELDDATPELDRTMIVRAFDFNAKRVFLTFSQVPAVWTKDWLLQKMMDRYGGIGQYVIGREMHPVEGGWHFHCYLELSKKTHTRDPRFFDIGGFHPHIKVVKRGKEKGCQDYCRKDGDYIHNYNLLSAGIQGFAKRRADLDAFESYAKSHRQSTLPLAFPMDFQFHGVVLDPAQGKKRHWLIVGPPDKGKSSTIQRMFAGKEQHAYMAVPGNMPLDDYEGQQVIIFDDHFPKKETIVSIAEVYQLEQKFQSRYHNRAFKPYQQRFIIVVHNSLPDYARDPWFIARFNICLIN